MAKGMLGLWEDAARDLHIASKFDFDGEATVMLKKVIFIIWQSFSIISRIMKVKIAAYNIFRWNPIARRLQNTAKNTKSFIKQGSR